MTQKILFSTVSALALALQISSSTPLCAMERVDDGDSKGAARAALPADGQALVPAAQARRKIKSIQDVKLTAKDQELLTQFCLNHLEETESTTREEFTGYVLKQLSAFFRKLKEAQAYESKFLKIANLIQFYNATSNFLERFIHPFVLFRKSLTPARQFPPSDACSESAIAKAHAAYQAHAQQVEKDFPVAFERGAGQVNRLLQDINRGVFCYFEDVKLIPPGFQTGVITPERLKTLVLDHHLLAAAAHKNLREQLDQHYSQLSPMYDLVYWSNKAQDDVVLYRMPGWVEDDYTSFWIDFGSIFANNLSPNTILLHKRNIVTNPGFMLTETQGGMVVQGYKGISKGNELSSLLLQVQLGECPLVNIFRAETMDQKGETKFIAFPNDTDREQNECELALLEEVEPEIDRLLKNPSLENQERARLLLEELVPSAAHLLAPAQEAKEEPADKVEAIPIDDTVAKIKAEIQKRKEEYMAMITAEQAQVTQDVAKGDYYLEKPKEVKKKKGNRKKKKGKGAAVAAAAPAWAQNQGGAAAAKPQAIQNQGGGAAAAVAAAGAAQAPQAQAFGNQGRVKFRALARVLAAHIKQLPLKDMRKMGDGSHRTVHLDGAQSATVVPSHKRPKDKTLPASVANRVVNRFLETFMQHLSGTGEDS